MGTIAGRIVVVLAWIGGMFALTAWSNTTAAVVCAVAATVVTGLLVGRWWLLLVPTGPAAVVAIGFLLTDRDPGEWWDADPADYAVGVVMLWAVIVALLAVGVAGHKLLMRARDHRTGARRTPAARGRVSFPRA